MSQIDHSYLEWLRFFTKTLPDKYTLLPPSQNANGKPKQLPNNNNKKKNKIKE